MTHPQFNECVNKYADRVYRFVLKNLRHEEDAKDVVQASFEKLWMNVERVEFDRCKSYLFTIAYHQMIDTIRKSKRVQLVDEFCEKAQMVSPKNANAREVLDRALYTLNETQRSLVLLKDYEGYSYEEIAVITSLSHSQVKVYLHRARLALRNYLVKPENVM